MSLPPLPHFTPRRGDIWRYKALRARTVLVVSADEMTSAGLPMTIDITDVKPTGARSMLAVPIPGHGYALIHKIVGVDPGGFLERVGAVDRAALDAVGMGLRSALDLS